MKALSLWQPWASAIALDLKRVETRSWPCRLAMPLRLAIHATTSTPPAVMKAVEQEGGDCRMMREAFAGAGVSDLRRLPGGCVVAVATLRECLPADEVADRLRTEGGVGDDVELAFGDYGPGRWAWVLGDVKALFRPVPCRGARGLWDLPADVLALVEAQVVAPGAA